MEVLLVDRYRIRLLALAVICVLTLKVMVQEPNSIELTQADLFGLPNWRHKLVAVSGFTLGMTRARAITGGESGVRTLEVTQFQQHTEQRMA